MKYFNIVILIVIALSSSSCRRRGNETRIDPQNNSVFRITCELKNFNSYFDLLKEYHAEYWALGFYEEYYLRPTATRSTREYEIKYITHIIVQNSISIVNVVIGIREINGEYKGYYFMWDTWGDNIPGELDITTNLTASELKGLYPEYYPKIDNQIKVRSLIHKDYKKIVIDFSKNVKNLDFFNSIKLIE